MNRGFNIFERTLLISAVVILIISVVLVIYSFGFLSNNLIRALRPEKDIAKEIVEFNLNGYEQLGL